MSKQQADQLVYGDLDTLRNETSKLGHQFHQAESLDRWISTASKKQLLSEIIHLLSSNHANVPF